jgi:hypothetical protein
MLAFQDKVRVNAIAPGFFLAEQNRAVRLIFTGCFIAATPCVSIKFC